MAFLPFDAMLYQEGLRRGYTPVQMAAAVGNRRAESGSNPLGAIGDTNLGPGQEAFGGFQWRLDRQQRLRQSGDVSNPLTHINHFFNELDSSEAKAGNMLRNAQTIAEANNAMKAYLRYGDDTLGKRQQYAQEAAQMFGNGQIPPELMMAGYDPNAQGTQIIPGAQEQQGPDIWGGLKRAAASLASANSPEQSAALLRGIQDTEDQFMTSVNQDTGQIVRVNKATGQIQITNAPQLRAAQMAQNTIAQNQQLQQLERELQLKQKYAPGPKVSDGLRKMQAKDFETASMYANLTDDMADIMGAIRNGEVDYNLFNNYKNTAFSIMGLSPEQKTAMGLSPRAVEVFQKFERLKNVTALEEGMRQAGVETDRDFLNAIKANFGSNNFDGQNVDIALRDLIKKSARVSRDASRLYESRATQYSNDAELADPYRRETILSARERAQKHLEAVDQLKPLGTTTQQRQQQAPAAPKWRLLP